MAFKPHYAIRTPPIPLLQREALKSTFKVGDVELDASKDKVPELESDDRNKVVLWLKIFENYDLLAFLSSLVENPIKLEKLINNYSI
jgi:hypothetical protein